MGETFVTLWGNIATEPKAVSTAGGHRITKFRLACTASRRDAQTGEYSDGVTSWYSIACWRDLGVNVSASLLKGQPVMVYGKQVIREWETDDGKKGTDVSIDAIAVGHDLRWGQAGFQRVKRGHLAADPGAPEEHESARPDEEVAEAAA
jgi:single-strand DNA-binding protein